MTRYSGLEFAEDERRLIAVIVPAPEAGLARATLDDEGLAAALAEAGYGGWQLFPDALASLIARYNEAEAEAGLRLAVGERRDANLAIEIAADAMHAFARVEPARGGKGLAEDDVYQALGGAGVTFGIDAAAVSAACAAGLGGAPARVLVAAGEPAINGENARFTLLVDDARERTPHVDAHGLIDFRDLGAIPTVLADAPLMRREPASVGRAGRNVRGEAIDAVLGRDEPFAAKLLGAYIDKDDRNLLRAIFAGQPVRCGNAVSVEQILRLRDVNMATGNISFDGTVHVEGEVLPGMKVHATGDIVVGSVVDGAELKADGDIRVAGGIIAKARVQAGGAVAARFVENAQIAAGTTITIDDTALQSDLQANNQIVVGAKSRRGRLAGGSARAMMLIRAPILGAQTSGLTRLQLGVNPVLEHAYEELLKRIEKMRADEDALEKVVKHLSGKSDKAEMLGRAKASWQQALQAWGALLPERDELERQLALTAGARVVADSGVEGAVDLSFGKKVGHLRRAYASGSFTLADDKVCFTDAAGKLTPAD